MPVTLIQQKPDFHKVVILENKLAIAEMFCDTLQGEGVTTGIPSTFLRVQGCTLQCVWCDTLEVWPYGNEYTFDEVFKLFEDAGMIDKFQKGQHLILTGGSPLKQQSQLVKFIHEFIDKYGFKPYIEVENEAVLLPSPDFEGLVDQWNNSPKLANSGMKERVRLKPQIISHMAALHNSWFKFVVQNEDEWKEIEKDYLPLININQVILMPEGQTQAELAITRPIVADLAIKHGVRFTDRLHVTIWNKKTGV